MLFQAQPPAAVFDQEGIEDVGADVKRIVRLQQIFPARMGFFQNGAGKEHADRLAADEAGADHALPYGQNVAQAEILFGQCEQAVITRDRHVHQGTAHGVVFAPRFFAALDILPQTAGLMEQAVPFALSAAHQIQARPGHGGQDFGGGRTFVDRCDLITFDLVQHVHGWRIAVLDLGRVKIEIAPVAMDVDKDLGGARNRCDRIVGVLTAQEGKIGERLHIIDVRADQPEKVAQHAVAAPYVRQNGQAIKEKIGAPPRLAHGTADLDDDFLEPLVEFEGAYLEAFALWQQRW
ncbi:MAG: hypothetical protein BWY57_02471 [Betaproteobacteria bacterium ADurb.Bin341]|nr:MAG: hypothetical protein BWY57_02471 [Betaproteobacteria bacterium ADurb.Bin341]